MKPLFRNSLLISQAGALAYASLTLAAGPLTFPDLWEQIQSRSKTITASRLDTEAAQVTAEQGARHWLPRLYADLRAFSTNDPASAFMGLLNQRRISTQDFAPETLNQPGGLFFQKGTLGMQLPLFEGGAGAANARASEKALESSKLREIATRTQQYLEAARNYGEVSLLSRKKHELRGLQELVETTLAHYKVGSRSNPLGYSGLLGLKTLKNRMEAVALDFEARSTSAVKRLNAMSGGLPEGWRSASAERWDIFEFTERHLSVRGDSRESSHLVKAAFAQAAALRENVVAERAREIPGIGLFAEGNLNHGERDTATGYVAGAYLSWEIFSPRSHGSARKANAQASAMEARAEAARLDENATREGMTASTEALHSGITLSRQSQELLAEQSQMARTLFLNGSINVLQMVEIYARRLDVIEGLARAEETFLTTRSAELSASGFNPSDLSGSLK